MRTNLTLWGFSLIFLAGWAAGLGFGPPACETLTPCKCRFPWGRGFDLSNITTLNFTLPSTSNDSSSSDIVVFNPCPPPPGTTNACPENAAICKISSGGNTTQILGLHVNLTVSTVGPNTIAEYPYIDDNNALKTTSVIWKCAYSGEATTLTEDSQQPGRFVLTSKDACQTNIAEEADEMSAGATFLFIFFSLFAVYFFGGMAILKYIKGAQGVEMIPNYEFWSSLPSLVKDGFYFAMSGCRGSPSYDRI